MGSHSMTDTGDVCTCGCQSEVNAMSQKESTLPSFNPTNNEQVAEIKRRTEELMEYLRSSVPDNRCRSIALTNYEQAAMWAVKANFT